MSEASCVASTTADPSAGSAVSTRFCRPPSGGASDLWRVAPGGGALLYSPGPGGRMTSPSVTVETVPARKLAAVRRRVTIGAVGTAWKPALDQVWAFLRAHPGLRTDGHNVFVYHPPARRDDPMDVDFG